MPSYYEYLCVDCASTESCTKCFVSKQPNVPQLSEECLGTTCGTMTNNSLAVIKCNTDYFDILGATCNCCGISNKNISVCSTNHPALSLKTVVNWVIPNNSSNSSKSSKFESSYYLFTFAILFIAFLIAWFIPYNLWNNT